MNCNESGLLTGNAVDDLLFKSSVKCILDFSRERQNRHQKTIDKKLNFVGRQIIDFDQTTLSL